MIARASRMLVAVACAALTWSLAVAAHAEFPSFVHVVREGETLASIAQRYYGDPRREGVLVAENGLEAQGGAAIVVGMRLVIPQVAYHRVSAGETWAMIAERTYGDVRRAYAIVEANPAVESSQPPEGAELLLPYPLRHVADQRDTLNRVAQLYFDDTSASRTLRRFNFLRRTQLTRGQVILVPLPNLTLSPEGRRIVADATGVVPNGGEVRALQERIGAELPALQEHVRAGRYTETIALGNRLLGAGELTGNQVVTIERSLAVAYVALGREDLAIAAFLEAMRHQPDFELDTRRTSPTVLHALEAARAERDRAAAGAQADDAGTTDADAGTAQP